MKTKSEGLFEAFLGSNSLQFKAISEVKEKDAYRPDYLVTFGRRQLVFELKELTETANSVTAASMRTLGDAVRRHIQKSRKQVQYGCAQGIPSILLIYNNADRPWQMDGTLDEDFETAMYGELTIDFVKGGVGKGIAATSEIYNGKNQLLQASKNTSFSAVGRLCDRGGKTMVTLFENAFAKYRISYDEIPPCFDVRRAEISNQPLSFSPTSER